MRTRRAAYGILAACGAGALVTLAIAFATLGVLSQPTAGSAATAPPTPTPGTSTPATGTTTPPPTTGTTAPPLTPSTPTKPARTPSASAPPKSRTTPVPTPPVSPGTPTYPRATSTEAARPAESAKWLRVLEGLDAGRARAFATLDAAQLDAIYVRGSSPWAADRALLASYRERRIRIEALRLQIQAVTVETSRPTTVVLRIVDRLISGAAVTASGQRTHFPPGQPTARRLTLTTNAGRWRISAITRA